MNQEFSIVHLLLNALCRSMQVLQGRRGREAHIVAWRMCTKVASRGDRHMGVVHQVFSKGPTVL